MPLHVKSDGNPFLGHPPGFYPAQWWLRTTDSGAYWPVTMWMHDGSAGPAPWHQLDQIELYDPTNLVMGYTPIDYVAGEDNQFDLYVQFQFNDANAGLQAAARFYESANLGGPYTPLYGGAEALITLPGIANIAAIGGLSAVLIPWGTIQRYYRAEVQIRAGDGRVTAWQMSGAVAITDQNPFG